jgi:purine-nucleoside phosphorylase
MSNIPTPHITCEKGAFAPTVLMPGDPLRSKFIAETFLENPVLVNNTRGVQGYTGTWHGKPVSVMASGMGMPAIGIYSYELYNFYGVENIIRIGSAGGMREDVRLRDLVFGMGTCTNSNFAAHFELHGTYAPIASYELLAAAVAQADKLGARYHVGNLLSSDLFYNEDAEEANAGWRKMGVYAVEMEAAALYMTAARAGKRALAICTISDHLLTHESCSAEEREKTFTTMMEVALNTAVEMS